MALAPPAWLRGCSPRGEGEPLSTATPLAVSTRLPPPWTGKGGRREPALGSQTQQSVAEGQMVVSVRWGGAAQERSTVLHHLRVWSLNQEAHSTCPQRVGEGS